MPDYRQGTAAGTAAAEGYLSCCLQVNAAIEDVLLEAAADEDEGLDFAAFKALVSVPSSDSLASLDQYDARLPRGDGASSVDGSVHDRDHALHLLEVVPETD